MADRTLLCRIAAAVAFGLLLPTAIQVAIAASIVCMSLAVGVAVVRDPQQVRELAHLIERIVKVLSGPPD